MGDNGKLTDFERHFGLRMQATRSRPPKRRWSRQWRDYMESLQMGARLGRGRQYATGGNVRSLEVAPGVVEAIVQGSDYEPYRCRILCEAMKGKTKAKLVESLQARPMLLARMLVGDLPEEVETRFRAEGLPLTPSELAPLTADCSCPDGAHFCKHAAAVMFLLVEVFDANPLLLLKFRGVSEQDLYGDVGGEGGKAEGRLQADNGKGAVAIATEQFVGGDLIEFPGSLPFWRGESRFAESIQDCIDRAAEGARKQLGR